MTGDMQKAAFFRLCRLLAFTAFLCAGACGAARALTISAPVESWTVGPIQAKSSSGVGYCSMKNTYDDGKVLVFARDAEGSNSVAIDFHKKILKVGAQYVVGMKVGMVERKMLAIAATPAVLIVQMGLDHTYYETLRRKAVMQLSFNGDEMAFALNGTGDALAALSKCAVAVGQGKAYPVTHIAAGKIPADKLAGDVAAVLPAADEPALPQSGVVQNPNPDDFDLGRQSAEATLRRQIAELQAENRKLLLQNQAIAARMLAEDKGRHPLAQPDPPEEVVAMPPGGMMMHDAAPMKAINVKTFARARAGGKTHVVSASIVPAGGAEAANMAAAPSVEPAAGAGVTDSGFLRSLLFRAGIKPHAAGKGRYTWKTDDVYGGALEGPVPQGADFNRVVANYLNEARTRCGGDFARKLGLVETLSGKTVQTGEIVCIDGRHDVGAALLFVQDGGNFLVVTHEGTTDQMDEALAKRKAVLSKISG
jgi:hypothetical protein